MARYTRRAGLHTARDREDKSIEIWSLNKRYWDQDYIEKLDYAMENAKNDGSIKAIVLKSQNPDYFCEGSCTSSRAGLPEHQLLELSDLYRNFLQNFRDLQLITVAAINASATGGGAEVAMACDLIYTTDKAGFNFNNIQRSFITGAGCQKWLASRLSAGVAKNLIFQSETIDGKQAFEVGFTNKNVTFNPNNDEAFAEALKSTKTIVNQAPLATKMVKFGMNKLENMSTDEALGIEESLYQKIIPSKDRSIGIRAFRDKTTARYTGQ